MQFQNGVQHARESVVNRLDLKGVRQLNWSYSLRKEAQKNNSGSILTPYYICLGHHTVRYWLGVPNSVITQ